MAARSLGFSARSTRRCSGRACFGPCFVSTLLWLVLVLAPGPDEDRQRSPPAPRRRIGEAAFHVVHVCVATDQLLPVGLLAVVNSTLHHSCNRSALVFHVVVLRAGRAHSHPRVALPGGALLHIRDGSQRRRRQARGRLCALRAGAGAGRGGRLHARLQRRRRAVARRAAATAAPTTTVATDRHPTRAAKRQRRRRRRRTCTVGRLRTSPHYSRSCAA